MTGKEMVKALRDKGLSWDRIAEECGVDSWKTARNWGGEEHHGPGKSALKLLKQLYVREIG